MGLFAQPGAGTLLKPQALQHSFRKKTRSPFDPNKDYCGSQGFDAPDGNWAEACKAHDDCYETPGQNKEVCDIRLARDIALVCSLKTYLPGPCAIPGVAYGIGLIVLGIQNPVFQPSRNAYDQAQKKGK